jgi:hypothetical protein
MHFGGRDKFICRQVGIARFVDGICHHLRRKKKLRPPAVRALQQANTRRNKRSGTKNSAKQGNV